VLVELTTTNETLRVLTDNQGRFRFNEVRPGKKTLQAATDTLPKYYGFDKNTISLEIGPGQTQEITIKALPKKRSIQIIDQGNTIIQERAK
jgi:ribosomal protein S4E